MIVLIGCLVNGYYYLNDPSDKGLHRQAKIHAYNKIVMAFENM